jgi:hypothetical protein
VVGEIHLEALLDRARVLKVSRYSWACNKYLDEPKEKLNDNSFRLDFPISLLDIFYDFLIRIKLLKNIILFYLRNLILCLFSLLFNVELLCCVVFMSLYVGIWWDVVISLFVGSTSVLPPRRVVKLRWFMRYALPMCRDPKHVLSIAGGSGCLRRKIFRKFLMKHFRMYWIRFKQNHLQFEDMLVRQKVLRDRLDAYKMHLTCKYVGKRGAPVIAKAYQIPYLNIATKIMLGVNKLTDFKYEKKLEGYAIKEPVFSFNKFPNVNKELGPEMKSTGEAIRFIKTLRDPWFRQLYKDRSMYLSK